MKNILIKSKIITVVLFSFFITLSGCSSSPTVDEHSKKNMEQKPIYDVNASSQQSYEQHLAEWQEMKNSVQRLIVIEAELTELIEYLNNIAKAAEANKEVVQSENPPETIVVASPNTIITPIDKPTNTITSAETTNSIFYSLQLAAVTKESQIQTSWQALTTKHPNELKNLVRTYEESVIKGVTYYRIKAGKFTIKSDAEELCNQLSALNSPCIVKNHNGTGF